MTTPPLGARRREWVHFAEVLGWCEDLLPVVPDPAPSISPFSAVKTFGKIPSEYDSQGRAYGLKGWQSRAITPQAVDAWMDDPRLGICVRARRVRAIDIDAPDAARAREVERRLRALAGDVAGVTAWSARYRDDSGKRLLPFYLAGELRKRKITLKDEGGIVEMLADGQQWVCAGTHPAGARYAWRPAIDRVEPGFLPLDVPAFTLEQLEALWRAIETEFASHAPKPGAASPEVIRAPDDSDGDEALLDTIEGEPLHDLQEILAWPPFVTAAVPNDFWSEVGYALLSLGGVGRSLFAEFSARIEPRHTQEAEWWDKHAGQRPRSDYRHIFSMARRLGWGRIAPVEAFGPPIDTTDSSRQELLPAPPARPTIRLVQGMRKQYAPECEALLAAEVFKQGGALVRIGAAEEITKPVPGETRIERARAPQQPVVLPVTPAYVERRLDALADFVKYDGRTKAWMPQDCPLPLAVHILGQKDWPDVRPLVAVATSPFMRRDGTLCSERGYDEASGMLLLPNAPFIPLRGTPTRDEALAALDALREPFDQFPFEDGIAEAAFIAHILTEVARPAIETAPLMWYSAPTAGTGKSMLADMPALLTHGVLPSRRAWVNEQDEMRKNLYASLLMGDRSITFDNLPTGAVVRSPILCAFLTSDVYADRKLAESTLRAISNRTVVTASGNNVAPAGDLTRRTIGIRLDANMSKRELHQRTFRIPILSDHVIHNRCRLLHAAHTILVGAQAHAHHRVAPLPSFERWSRFVRDALLWLGMDDPVLSMRGDETDDEGADAGAAGNALVALTKLGTLPAAFQARDVVDSLVIAPDNGALDALTSAGCDAPLDVTKVGYWLRRHLGVVECGLKLVKRPPKRGAACYAIVSKDVRNLV